MTTKELLDILARGVAANHEDKHRRNNRIELHDEGLVVMTGDLHNHRRNYEKLVRFSDLGSDPNRHLILHELIHSSNLTEPHQCHSYELVADAVRLKTQYPDQVHYLLGNHAMAQVCRDEILKNGQPMVKSFQNGVHAVFGSNSDLVMKAFDDFFLSLPLAVRTANRIWLSHSLPSSRHVKDFDDSLFEKELTMDDMHHNSSLRALTWDRRHDESGLETLAGRWDVDAFVVGHQHQERGYRRELDRMIILASDHNHGAFLPFRLDRSYRGDDLENQIKEIASLH